MGRASAEESRCARQPVNSDFAFRNFLRRVGANCHARLFLPPRAMCLSAGTHNAARALLRPTRIVAIRGSPAASVSSFSFVDLVRVPRRGGQFHVPGTGLAVCASLLLGASNVLRPCSELDCVEYLFINANGSVWARDRPPTTSTHYTAIRCLRRNSRNVHASVPDEHTFVLLQRRQLIRWSCHATDSYFHSNEHGWPVPSVDCHSANPRQLHPHRQRWRSSHWLAPFIEAIDLARAKEPHTYRG